MCCLLYSGGEIKIGTNDSSKEIIKTLRGTSKYFSNLGMPLTDEMIYLALNLKFGCSKNCIKCFKESERRYKELNLNKDIYLTKEDWFSIIDQVVGLKLRTIIFAGSGEPSLDKNIRDYVKKTVDNGMIPIVYSNGLDLNPKLANFYRENNVVLALSIDSLDKSRWNFMSGFDISNQKFYKNAFKNINHIFDIYKDTSKREGSLFVHDIALITTLCGININDVNQMKNFAENNNAYFVCNPLAKEGAAVDNWNILMDKVNIDKITEIAYQFSEPDGPLTFNGKSCGYSKNGLSIDEFGDFNTCAYTKKTKGLMGNIKNTSLKKAFNYKFKLESQHYNKFGNVPCLIRSNNFNNYLESF